MLPPNATKHTTLGIISETKDYVKHPALPLMRNFFFFFLISQAQSFPNVKLQIFSNNHIKLQKKITLVTTEEIAYTINLILKGIHLLYYLSFL